MREVRAVFFDIGETLVDRSREYAAWAELFGLPPHTFSAVFGARIAAGATVRQVVESFGGDGSFDALRPQLRVPPVDDSDLYRDARGCLTAARELGYFVGIAGNQPPGFGAELRALDLPADVIATSSDWGTAKPSGEFFARVVSSSGAQPADIVYVGDQLYDDIAPARAAGMNPVWIRRGPWGLLVRDPVVEQQCAAVIDGLDELPPWLAARI